MHQSCVHRHSHDHLRTEGNLATRLSGDAALVEHSSPVHLLRACCTVLPPLQRIIHKCTVPPSNKTWMGPKRCPPVNFQEGSSYGETIELQPVSYGGTLSRISIMINNMCLEG